MRSTKPLMRRERTRTCSCASILTRPHSHLHQFLVGERRIGIKDMDDAFVHELEAENRVKLSQIASWEHDMLPPESGAARSHHAFAADGTGGQWRMGISWPPGAGRGLGAGAPAPPGTPDRIRTPPRPISRPSCSMSLAVCSAGRFPLRITSTTWLRRGKRRREKSLG